MEHLIQTKIGKNGMPTNQTRNAKLSKKNDKKMNKYTEAEIEKALREILEMREGEIINFLLHLIKILRENH